MNDTATPHRSSDTREIRVFISSTFRDMMRERDLLVKEKVFPALLLKCAILFITFTEVDLYDRSPRRSRRRVGKELSRVKDLRQLL